MKDPCFKERKERMAWDHVGRHSATVTVVVGTVLMTMAMLLAVHGCSLLQSSLPLI